jgi:hypothetical protein
VLVAQQAALVGTPHHRVEELTRHLMLQQALTMRLRR